MIWQKRFDSQISSTLHKLLAVLLRGCELKVARSTQLTQKNADSHKTMKSLNLAAFGLVIAIMAEVNSNAQGVVNNAVVPQNPAIIVNPAPVITNPVPVITTNSTPGPNVVTNGQARGPLAAPDESRGMPMMAKANAAHFFIESGAYLLNPYKIDPVTHILQTGDTEASVYVQLNYANLWAFTPKRRQRILNEQIGVGWNSNENGASTWLGFDGAIDLQAKMGFVFQDDETPTASTIVGSGDFMTEITLGYNVWRDLRVDKGTKDVWLAQSAGLELSYGAVTDRGAFDVHHRIFAGPGYCAAIAMESGRESLIHFRLGAAGIESVSYLNSTTKEVEYERGDPRYNLEWTFAFEAEAYVPIMQRTFLTFGTRIYGGNDPNMWTAYIGITRPLDNIVGWLFP